MALARKILICIDGTGPWSDSTYATEMANSFVHQIYLKSTIAEKFYHRGPSLTGIESGIIGISAFMDYLKGLAAAAKSGVVELYITGYSRGAMIAIYLANRVAEFNALNGMTRSVSNFVRGSFGYSTSTAPQIIIKHLLLFDPVDSDATMAGPGIRVIPNIVRTCTNFVCGESSQALPRSRWYFNRIELQPAEGVRTIQHSFVCTHACIGGLPGAGDHRTPLKPGELKATAVSSLTRNPAQTILNPGTTVVRTVGSTAARYVDSVKSNVTLDEDWRAYDKVYPQVLRELSNGWQVSGLPKAVRKGRA
jgi:hypothetical protein